jgi:hypothetical protein
MVLSRNTGKRGYRHKQANRLAGERHQKKNKAIMFHSFFLSD